MRKNCDGEKKIICQNFKDSHVFGTCKYEKGDLKRLPSARLPLCLSVCLSIWMYPSLVP
jgi:hypothetical protein